MRLFSPSSTDKRAPRRARRGGLTLLETLIGSLIAAGAAAIAAALLVSYARMSREMATRDQIASRLDQALKSFEAGAKPAARASVAPDGKSVELELADGAVERWAIAGGELTWESGGRPPAVMLSGLAPTSRFAEGDSAAAATPSLRVSLHLKETDSEERYHALTVDAIVALRVPPIAGGGPSALP